MLFYIIFVSLVLNYGMNFQIVLINLRLCAPPVRVSGASPGLVTGPRLQRTGRSTGPRARPQEELDHRSMNQEGDQRKRDEEEAANEKRKKPPMRRARLMAVRLI